MALQQLHDWLYNSSTNGSTTALLLPISPIQSSVRMALHYLYKRFCNGSTKSLRTVLERLYERPYERFCNGSATVLQRLYDGSIMALQTTTNGSTTAPHRLYDGSTVAHTVVHTIVYKIVCINDSASALRTARSASSLRAAPHRLYERPCIVFTNGPASSLRTALHRLRTALRRLYDGSTIAYTIVYTNGSTTTL
jgi:hypothetical protein